MAVKTITPKNWRLTAYGGRFYSAGAPAGAADISQLPAINASAPQFLTVAQTGGATAYLIVCVL